MIWIAAHKGRKCALSSIALPKACGKVVLAYDNDKEDDKYRSATHQILKGSGKEVVEHLPQKKDFNEDLKDTTQ